MEQAPVPFGELGTARSGAPSEAAWGLIVGTNEGRRFTHPRWWRDSPGCGARIASAAGADPARRSSIGGFLDVSQGHGNLDAADVDDERVIGGLGKSRRHRGLHTCPGTRKNPLVSRTNLTCSPDNGVRGWPPSELHAVSIAHCHSTGTANPGIPGIPIATRHRDGRAQFLPAMCH